VLCEASCAAGACIAERLSTIEPCRTPTKTPFCKFHSMLRGLADHIAAGRREQSRSLAHDQVVATSAAGAACAAVHLLAHPPGN